jgi:Domain of unknown function (DUF4062)
MAEPRVFISSTCYDLSEVRDHLDSFIVAYGFAPCLSDKGDVFYHPHLHTHESCIKEVGNCQILILVIGGRFGGKYVYDPEHSVVNAEYDAAVKSGLPVFAFIKDDVLADHRLYTQNKEKIDAFKGIVFPSIDKQEYALRIFRFIDEVRFASINNGYFGFRFARDIEEILRKQWAGLFFESLTQRKEANKVKDSLQAINALGERIELLSEQILSSVGSDLAKITAQCYDIMLKHECIRDLSYMGVRATPAMVLSNEQFPELMMVSGKIFKIPEDKEGITISSDGTMSPMKYEICVKSYETLRQELLQFLEEKKMPPERVITG